jgi:protein-tyrosine phosphatase
MVKVLFVCMGNICRSPMAEGVFRHLVSKAGLTEQISIDSAGTSAYHVGQKAHRGTLAVLAKHDIPYDGRARHFIPEDFAHFDYILAMDKDNLNDILRQKRGESSAVVKLFLDYSKGFKESEVPDPYYDGRFEYVYEMVDNAGRGLLAAIRAEHGL